MAGKKTSSASVQPVASASAPETSKPDIKKDEMLKTEFDYAANSAFQANEDRSKVASFFLVSVGSLVAAILGVDTLNLSPNSHIGLAGLFFVLTLLGLLTVMQLARLREAWIDSAKVMNKIKDYYIGQFREPKSEPNKFADAFRWRTNTIPAPYKLHSVSNYTVLEVALLSGLTFGAAVYYMLNGPAAGADPIKCIWWLTIGAGLFAFLFELFIYKRMLNE